MKIIFLGDFLIDQDFDICEKLKEIFSDADYIFANFEGPIIEEGQTKNSKKAGPVVRQLNDVVNTMKKIGITNVTLCNNHIYDYKEEGITNTIHKLNESSISCFGIDLANLTSVETVIPYKEKKIIMISACEYHEGSKYVENNDEGLINLFSDELEKKIKEYREENSYIILLCHAGLEGVDVPLKQFRSRYKNLISYGADMIICHHPHVIQGIEHYKGRKIFYSLGDFIFSQKNIPRKVAEGMAVIADFNQSGCSTKLAFFKQKHGLIKHIHNYDIDLISNKLSDQKYYENIIKNIYNQGLSNLEEIVYKPKSLKTKIKLLYHRIFNFKYLERRKRLIKRHIESNHSYIFLKSELENINE